MAIITKVKYEKPEDAIEVIDIIASAFEDDNNEEINDSKDLRKLFGCLTSGDWGKRKGVINKDRSNKIKVELETMFREMEIDDHKRGELFLILYRAIALIYIMALADENGHEIPGEAFSNMWTLKVINKDDFYNEGIKELRIFSPEFDSKEEEARVKEIISAEADTLRDNEENIKVLK